MHWDLNPMKKTKFGLVGCLDYSCCIALQCQKQLKKQSKCTLNCVQNNKTCSQFEILKPFYSSFSKGRIIQRKKSCFIYKKYLQPHCRKKMDDLQSICSTLQMFKQPFSKMYVFGCNHILLTHKK